MQFDGKQYGVPTDLSLHFMYYRKDLIDALMKDDAGKRKYAEISKKYLGKELQRKTQTFGHRRIGPQPPSISASRSIPPVEVRYGTMLQMKNLLFNMMVFQSLPRAYGADWADKDGNVTVDWRLTERVSNSTRRSTTRARHRRIR